MAIRVKYDGLRGLVQEPAVRGGMDFRASDTLIGSVYHQYVSVTSGVSLDGTVSLVLADATGGPLTITLPDAARFDQLTIVIKKIDTTTTQVSITPQPGQTIDGSSSLALIQS